jgi:adenylate kinase family enzyme
MAAYDSKLIILRGNSGSGKSTIAKRLREGSSRKIAIVEQDYLRKFVLKEKETESTDNIGLIEQTVEYALSHHYDVILEGILYFPRYGDMLKRLVSKCPNHYVFYFDISFDETLRRHVTKPNAHEFGEKEMREWYTPNQTTGFKGEQIILEASSEADTIAFIQEQTGL